MFNKKILSHDNTKYKMIKPSISCVENCDWQLLLKIIKYPQNIVVYPFFPNTAAMTNH